MFKNYLKIAQRNFLRNKLYSFINILGLAIGITCFITLALFIIDEIGYDTFNKNADNICKVFVDGELAGKSLTNSKTAASVGSMLKDNFPEVVDYARIGYQGQFKLNYGEKTFNESHIYTTDSAFFQIFTLPLIYGDPNTALAKPNSIVLTETFAKKFFGNENPVGKTFLVNDSNSYLITGLMKDFPKKSHFSCRALISIATFPPEENQYVLNLWYSTYILLKEGTDKNQFEKKIENVASTYIDPQIRKILGQSLDNLAKSGSSYEYRLQPLTSIHLYSSSEYGIDKNTHWRDENIGDIYYVYILFSIAFFILLIAVINFMNLSTARSEKKVKEVGIRKTLGSNKVQLIIQFISEAILMCFLAVLIALVLLQYVLPIFNVFVNRDLSLGLFSNVYSIPILLLFTLFVGVLAGSYPAFYLSSFMPSQIIKNKDGKKGGKKSFMSMMVIVQFTISIILIIGTIFIKYQMDFIQNVNLGFNKEYLITINNTNSKILFGKEEVFKNELLKNTNILSVTNSSKMFCDGIAGSGYFYDRNIDGNIVLAQHIDVDYDFLKTFDIKLKEGRFFSKDFLSDTDAVVVNEAALNEFNAVDPIGNSLTSVPDGDRKVKFNIIGVIKDFNYESLHKKVRPLVLNLSQVKDAGSMITIRVSSNNIKNTISYIENIWQSFTGEENCYYTFANERIAQLYSREEEMGDIALIFALLTVFIACLGLFGLASCVTEQRVKEIGIRKVLGASTSRIVYLLSKEFSKWVLLANLIAFPIAYYYMQKWLQYFAYKTEMNIWIFLFPGIITLVIALVTVISLTIKAATANPVESLKNE